MGHSARRVDRRRHRNDYQVPSVTLRVSMFGMSEGGKAVCLWNRFVSRHRKVLIVDTMGEWEGKPIKGHRVDGLEELLWALNKYGADQSFRIFAFLDVEEFPSLVRLLVPKKAYANSFVPAIGGMALYLAEVDQLIAPNAYDGARTLWRRGRHVELSVYADTQSISSCSKEVIKSVHAIGMLATTHSNDLETFQKEIRDDQVFRRAYEWSLRPYHCALWFPQQRRLALLPPCAEKLSP